MLNIDREQKDRPKEGLTNPRSSPCRNEGPGKGGCFEKGAVLGLFSLRPRPGQACPEAKKQMRVGAAGLSGAGAVQGQDGEEIAFGGGGVEQVSSNCALKWSAIPGKD